MAGDYPHNKASCVSSENIIQISDAPKQNSLEKLLVSFSVAWPVLLNFLIQDVLQRERVVFHIEVCHLGNMRRDTGGSICLCSSR